MSALDNLKMNAIWSNSEISDNPVFGILDDEKLEVFQMGNLAKFMMPTLTSKRIPFLYGTGQRYITLTNVMKTHFERAATNFQTSRYRYDNIILDLHYKESDKITKISFTYPFIWGPFRSKNLKDPNVSLNPINLVVTMDEHAKLTLGQTISMSMGFLEQQTTQSEFFQIEASTEMTLEVIMGYARSLNCFLRLCMGKIVFPEQIIGTITKDKSFEYYPYWLINYNQNDKFKNPQIGDQQIILFSDIKDDFESIMQKWMNLWFKTTEIMYDFFNVDESIMSVNTMFTEYTNVLQRFCDKLEQTPRSFEKKIDLFLNSCPPQIQVDIRKNDFIDKIVTTRNYNVHGEQDQKKYVVTDGNELIYLTKDLKTIIEIFLISRLSIKDSTSIMKRIYKLNNYARTNPIE